MSLEIARARRRCREQRGEWTSLGEAAASVVDKLEDSMNQEAKSLAIKAQAPLERTEPSTPMALLSQAVANGNIELAEKLMGLQERWEANQARKAFDNAMAIAKSNMPVILKEQEKTGAGGTYKYEDLAGIARAIDPILAAQGLSYRFRTESNGIVKVTCIISHRDGHSEENSLSSQPDTSGSKNAIQAIGSAVTYLQRYSLKAALGLAASKDDDGHAVGNGTANAQVLISDEQRDELIALADEMGIDKAAYCKHFGIPSLADIRVADFAKAKSAMLAKKGGK